MTRSLKASFPVSAVRLFIEWDWHGADEAFLRAIAINPRSAVTHLYRAVGLAWLGRHDEALRAAALACELEPDSMLINHIAASVQYWLRHYDLARASMNRSLALDPDASFPHWTISPFLSEVGQHELAIEGIEQAAAAAKRPGFLVSRLGRAYARGGRPDDAELVVNELLHRRHTEYVAPLHIADIYAALDRRDEAFDWFDRSYQDRNGFLPAMVAEPFYDPLRSEPRFAELLARMNLKNMRI